MYNEEQKIRFIREYTRSIKMADACESVFNAIAQYEERWGADLCTRTVDELTPVVESLVGVRVKSKGLRVIILKDYTKWCIAKKIAGARDDMLRVSVLGLGKLKTHMVPNPLQLQIYLNQICEPETEQTVDLIYRCYYWLAYSGMDEEDILKVQCSDVDFERMVVCFGGEEYPIYREALTAFRLAATLTEFVYKHPNYPPDKIVRRNRVFGNELVRGIRSAPTVMYMRAALSRRSKECLEAGKTEKHLSYYRVWMSGLFYRMREKELAGIPVDFSGVVSKFMEGKTYKLDSGRNTQEAKKRAIVAEYMEDYMRWKAAFLI